jgi:hypothetical protein
VNVGRITLGACTAMAVVGAVFFGVANWPTASVSSPAAGVGVCGSRDSGTPTERRSGTLGFVLRNDTASPIAVQSFQPAETVGLSNVTVRFAPGVGSLTGRGDEAVEIGDLPSILRGRQLSSTDSTTIPARGKVTVIAGLRLAKGSDSGQASDFRATYSGAFGIVKTVPVEVGVAIGTSATACAFTGG